NGHRALVQRDKSTAVRSCVPSILFAAMLWHSGNSLTAHEPATVGRCCRSVMRPGARAWLTKFDVLVGGGSRCNLRTGWLSHRGVALPQIEWIALAVPTNLSLVTNATQQF